MQINILAAASENQQTAYAKTMTQISCAVTLLLHGFTTWIVVQTLFRLKLKLLAFFCAVQLGLCLTW